MLSFHIAAGDLNRIQLVAADDGPAAPLACSGIEGPRAAALHYGNRNGQSSFPTIRNARLRDFGSRDTLIFSRAFAAKSVAR